MTVAGLTASRTVAYAALSAAQATLAEAQKAEASFPVDADPRMIALYAAREVATAALTVASVLLVLFTGDLP